MKLEWPRLVLFAWFSVLCGSTAMAQDLVISSVSLGPLRLTGGTDEVIHLSTRNIGSAVSPASTSVIVLSRDATIGRDDLVIGVVPVRSLVPNDTDSTQQSFPIPNCMGDWSPCWIGAIADVGNVVAESNENNNTVQQRLAGCRFGPSARGQVHWRPQWGTPALATTTATFDTSVGGTARMCLVGPPGVLYVCVWSFSRSPFTIDAASAFSLEFINTSVFPSWTGVTDTNGLAGAALAVPRLSAPLPGTVRVFTHAAFFDRGPVRLRSYSENSIEVILR